MGVLKANVSYELREPIELRVEVTQEEQEEKILKVEPKEVPMNGGIVRIRHDDE